MHSSQGSQNPSHRKTFQLICECLDETKKLKKEKVTEKLKDYGGKLAQLQRLLIIYPRTSSSVLLIVNFVFFVASLLIINYFPIPDEIRLTLFCIFFVLYFAIPIFLEWHISQFNMEWDEKWGRVLGSYLDKTNLNPIQAERRIKRAIRYYSSKGRPFSFIVNLLGSGIFIGCLSDPAFQKALMTMSWTEIYKANLLGAVCTVVMPLIYYYCIIKYDIPIAWMENVAMQIELEGLDD